MNKVENTALILLVGPDIRLLEQNILHYFSLGLKRILISVHTYDENAEHCLDKVTSIAQRYHAEIADIHTAQGIDSAARYRRLIDKCDKETWVVYADLDEFIQFPAPIADIIGFCDSEGFDYIQGFFLDRVGAKGDLPALSEQSIWDQFPVGMHLTQVICKGNANKIPLARARVTVVDGHHFATDGIACPQELCTAIVHHFKWDNEIVARCKAMQAINEASGLEWGHEYQRFLNYLEKGNGVIDFSAEGLQPYWPAYKRSHVTDYQDLDQPWSIYTDPNDLYPDQVADLQQRPLSNGQIRIHSPAAKNNLDADPITHFLFERADGEQSIHAISTQLAAAYPEQWWEIEADVQTVFRNLCHKGIVELHHTASSKQAPNPVTYTQSSRKPWVLYIIWSYPQVSETYIEKEIAALLEKYQVFVVGRYPADALTLNHVPYTITQSPAKMLGLIRMLRPAVIHTHWLDNVQLVAELATKTMTPYTIRTHSFDVEKINRRNTRMYKPELAAIWRDLLNHELCLGILTFPYSLTYFDDIGVSQPKVFSCYPVIDYPLFFNKSPNGQAIMNTGACHPKKDMQSFIDLALMLPEKEFNLYPVGYHTPVTVRYNEAKGRPVKIHDFAQPNDMPARYKQNNWLVYTGDIELKTVGWPLAVAEAQAAGLGICIPNLRPEMQDYLGGAGFTYNRIEEAAEIISQPYPETMREAGFLQAKKSDINAHKHLLESLWDKV